MPRTVVTAGGMPSSSLGSFGGAQRAENFERLLGPSARRVFDQFGRVRLAGDRVRLPASFELCTAAAQFIDEWLNAVSFGRASPCLSQRGDGVGGHPVPLGEDCSPEKQTIKICTTIRSLGSGPRAWLTGPCVLASAGCRTSASLLIVERPSQVVERLTVDGDLREVVFARVVDAVGLVVAALPGGRGAS